MTRMAGMQPYFFPYLGYWQLIDAVDYFVLFDEAQYIKQGWVNRNRILKPGGGWHYIVVPVARHPSKAAICEVGIATGTNWKKKILLQLAHYRGRAPCFPEAYSLVHSAIMDAPERSIGALNCHVVRTVCEALSIRSRLIVSSEHGFDYSNVAAPGDWALVHALHLGADEIINPEDGASMLETERLCASGIALHALLPPAVEYPQAGASFEPSLSIIDVLMFNGIKGTRELLSQRRLNSNRPVASGA